MKITIVSNLHNAAQAWTFDIEAADLAALMEKYDGKGASIMGSAEDIAEEIKTLYETK